MLVKAKERQISFLFQESDPFFEIGLRILEQERIAQMLPYRRKQQNGREKLIFEARNEHTVLLAEAISGFLENDIVDLLYEMIYLNKKVEENGFLKKECIWYQYDNIYYDKEKRSIMVAILPITGAFRYADNISWYNCFEETMLKLASYLPLKKAERVRKLAMMLKAGKMEQEEALDEINRLGCSVSGILSGNLNAQKNVILKLLYSGRNGRIEFQVEDRDFMIGRNAEAADGVIPAEFSRAVSRKHCLITSMNGKYFVQDLKSVNHTLVNGIMIPPYELMELENNDILSVADIEFRVLKMARDS